MWSVRVSRRDVEAAAPGKLKAQPRRLAKLPSCRSNARDRGKTDGSCERDLRLARRAPPPLQDTTRNTTHKFCPEHGGDATSRNQAASTMVDTPSLGERLHRARLLAAAHASSVGLRRAVLVDGRHDGGGTDEARLLSHLQRVCGEGVSRTRRVDAHGRWRVRHTCCCSACICLARLRLPWMGMGMTEAMLMALAKAGQQLAWDNMR